MSNKNNNNNLMEIRNICCIGAGYVAGLLCSNREIFPNIQVNVVDINSRIPNGIKIISLIYQFMSQDLKK